MPGGGCVPLIPYLISRSRGEALNPEHTHTLTLLLTHKFATKKHTCSFTGRFYMIPRIMLQARQSSTRTRRQVNFTRRDLLSVPAFSHLLLG